MFSEAPQLARLVTFAPNRRERIHNWYWYQEGFSRLLVDWLILKFEIRPGQIVLDPFCGVGTTNLTCKQNGIDSIGFDVNPVALLAARAKTANYNLQELARAVKDALKWKPRAAQIPKDRFLSRAFSKANLRYIFAYKAEIERLHGEIKDFMLLALIDAATKSSWTVKDHALIRIKRRPVPPVGRLFKYKIKKMLRDLERCQLPFTNTIIKACDARALKLKRSVDFVISSPPYLNKTEFAQMYKLELSLLGLPAQKLSGYMGAQRGTEQEYWQDMRAVLSELHRVTKPGARLALVVGGGCYPDKVVEVDKATAQLARQVGFEIEDILIARRTWCTRARTIKVGKMRESLLLMRRP